MVRSVRLPAFDNTIFKLLFGFSFHFIGLIGFHKVLDGLRVFIVSTSDDDIDIRRVFIFNKTPFSLAVKPT